MATLIVTETEDFRGESLDDITRIVFDTGPVGATAIFDIDQFGPGEISNQVAITGDDFRNHIEVNLLGPGATFSAAGWSFTNWNPFRDRVVLDGTTTDDTIVGSAQSDDIFGRAGADDLRGLAGADRFALFNGDISAGERIDGGTGSDSIQTGPASNIDLRGATIANVEQLIVGSDSSVTLNGDQIGASGMSRINGGTGGTHAIIVRGSFLVDLSGLTFFDWGGGGDTITINGTFNPDALTGSSENDTVDGGLGQDVIAGGSGDDSLDGGDAGDTLDGGAGNDTLTGGNGIDTASYALGPSTTVDLRIVGPQLTGGAGSDRLSGIENVTGSEFADLLIGDAGINVLTGLGGDDTIEGGVGIDKLFGNAGNDSLIGGGNSDTLDGGDGNDALSDDSGNDIMKGGAGADSFVGGTGDDAMSGGDGNDGFRAGIGADTFDGGSGIDGVNFGPASSAVIFLDKSGTNGGGASGDTFVAIENLNGSETGPDFLVGDGAVNRFTGNGGNDTLNGKGGGDQLEGGAGNDRLIGEQGNDVLVGGPDADRFVFNLALAAGGIDRTGDFAHLVDRIEIDASAFGGGLTAGGSVQLVANANPSSAGKVGGVFLYDTDSGFLSFDADGQGASAAVAFFRLQNLPALSAADFVVVA